MDEKNASKKSTTPLKKVDNKKKATPAGKDAASMPGKTDSSGQKKDNSSANKKPSASKRELEKKRYFRQSQKK